MYSANMSECHTYVRLCASPEVQRPKIEVFTDKSKRWTKEPLPCNVAGDEGGVWRVLCQREDAVTFFLEELGWVSAAATFQLPLEINSSYTDDGEEHSRNRG